MKENEMFNKFSPDIWKKNLTEPGEIKPLSLKREI